MQKEVFDEDKNVKSFSQFRKDADEITDVFQKQWLRVEYDTCRRSTIMGEQFRVMTEDKELYPYWVYKGVMDDREREEHVEMEGKIFKIGDAEGDECFPPNDWNCRCEGEPVDDDYLEENKKSVTSNAAAAELQEDNVDPQFRYNPGVQGMLPKEHSYFDAFSSANEGDSELFRLEPAQELGRKAEIEEKIPEAGDNGFKMEAEGLSIESAFTTIAEPVKSVAEIAFKAISDIHGIPEMKAIPIMSAGGSEFDGAYNHLTMGKSLDIEINKNALNKEFTLIHEIGHFIDDKAFGAFFETEGGEHGEMAGVLKAMKESETVKNLEKVDKSGMNIDGRGKLRKMDKLQKEVIKYYLNEQEQWARAYSQYIVTKSENPLLLKQLNYRRKMDNMGWQWPDNDFKNIIFEIDKLFIKKGWAKAIL